MFLIHHVHPLITPRQPRPSPNHTLSNTIVYPIGTPPWRPLRIPFSHIPISPLLQPSPIILFSPHPLNRQFRIPPSTRNLLQRIRNVRTNIRHGPDEPGDSRKEVAEEDEDAVELDDEADEGPAQQNKQNAGDEGGGAGDLLAASEEEERLLEADQEGEAADEEDLLLPHG